MVNCRPLNRRWVFNTTRARVSNVAPGRVYGSSSVRAEPDRGGVRAQSFVSIAPRSADALPRKRTYVFVAGNLPGNFTELLLFYGDLSQF